MRIDCKILPNKKKNDIYIYIKREIFKQSLFDEHVFRSVCIFPATDEISMSTCVFANVMFGLIRGKKYCVGN